VLLKKIFLQQVVTEFPDNFRLMVYIPITNYSKIFQTQKNYKTPKNQKKNLFKKIQTQKKKRKELKPKKKNRDENDCIISIIEPVLYFDCLYCHC
jgi:hypothetical protein